MIRGLPDMQTMTITQAQLNTANTWTLGPLVPSSTWSAGQSIAYNLTFPGTTLPSSVCVMQFNSITFNSNFGSSFTLNIQGMATGACDVRLVPRTCSRRLHRPTHARAVLQLWRLQQHQQRRHWTHVRRFV